MLPNTMAWTLTAVPQSSDPSHLPVFDRAPPVPRPEDGADPAPQLL